LKSGRDLRGQDRTLLGEALIRLDGDDDDDDDDDGNDTDDDIDGKSRRHERTIDLIITDLCPAHLLSCFPVETR